ncbi:MAG: hypothetical protein IJ681_01335 [Bacteroidales bacterium]|nr:hypothetical protein [Bacteroidales bacterium]
MFFLDTQEVITEDLADSLFPIFALLIIIGLIYLFYFLIPIKMAKKRGRNKTFWVILCFVLSPIWTYIILAIAGDSNRKRKQDMAQLIDEQLQKHLNNRQQFSVQENNV